MISGKQAKGRALTAGQSVLEDLLEAQEFENGQIDGRVKAKATFVRAKGGIELHPISPVDLHLAFVVFPNHAELDDPLRNRRHLQCLSVLGVFPEERGVFERRGEFCMQVVESVNASVRRLGAEGDYSMLLTFVRLLELGL